MSGANIHVLRDSPADIDGWAELLLAAAERVRASDKPIHGIAVIVVRGERVGTEYAGEELRLLGGAQVLAARLERMLG
jgi:hypothetical protein